MELKAPKPLGLLCSSCSELFLFLVAKLGGCQQTGEFLPELLGVSPRESDKPRANKYLMAGWASLTCLKMRCDVSPPQLQVVWRNRQPVNPSGRTSPGVLTAGQERTGGAFGLEDGHLGRTVECQAWQGSALPLPG